MTLPSTHPYTPAGSSEFEDGELAGPVRSYFARLSLRTRLTATVVIVLLIGLAIASLLTTTLLKSYLIRQVDDDLTTTYSAISSQLIAEQGSSSFLPSDYYLQFKLFGGETKAWYMNSTIENHSLPDLSAYITTGPGPSNAPSAPFTTKAVLNDTEWRVLYRQVATQGQGTIGEAYVALPLTDTYAIIDQIQRVLLLSGLFIAGIGGSVGLYAVGRSLRPLQNIEKTAAQIAQGDLSRRVPQAPASTEVGSLAKSLNTMLERLEHSFSAQEASERRMRQFVSDASHELRTPLATIRGYGELYRMGALKDADAMDDTMRRIEDSASRMGNLVEDLLHLARLDERKAMKSEPVDLAVLALDAVSDLKALDPSRSPRITELVPGVPARTTSVTGDEDKLRQVFANLVGNVYRHTPEGSPVEIALGTLTAPPHDLGRKPDSAVAATLPPEDATGIGQADREIVVVEVRDHGPGISSEHADRVFERFYRVDSSRNRKSGGSGLGLAIVSAILHAHNGTVRVFETPGGGLTVRLEIPASAITPL